MIIFEGDIKTLFKHTKTSQQVCFCDAFFMLKDVLIR